ncbi:hypothetical protein [Commensalibacter oyaizuii]|uniref:Uncharacterized protein n=1 Tax=Commensalibacter oyaizuii TaxID=3043873 RepID=A0ABT6PZB3_9PROT|nr:hypothetical protein [Commensalibacter sp. TBRC 16381]MDI2090195.1 hypothetical protein [Commensalibacter sp. TBRC 16381]
MIIFEGEELVLHYHEGHSDYIIITFNGAYEYHHARNTFFLEPVVKKYDISCIGINSKADLYYLIKEMDRVIDLCNDITKNYNKIIIMGLCMGGYGAIKYSRRLNADVVFTMNPRYTLNEKDYAVVDFVKSIMHNFSQEEIEKSTIQAEDVKGKIYIGHDPIDISDISKQDRPQKEVLLKILPHAVSVPIYFSGHITIHHLQGSQEMKHIIDALVHGEDQEVVKAVNKVRKHHITNILVKTNALMSKYPLLVYKMLTSLTFQKVKNNHLLLEDYPLRLRLCYLLNTNGYQQESSNYLKLTFFYRLMRTLSLTDIQSASINSYPYVISYNGFYLGYNFITKKIESIVNFYEKKFCLPLQLYKLNGKIRLVCVHQGVIFAIQYGKEDSFDLVLLPNTTTENSVKISFSDYRLFIQTKSKKQYICVSPNGDIATSNQLKEWESFTAIPMTYNNDINNGCLF